MQATIQNVINIFSKVTQDISNKMMLHAALITMTLERKNYTSMARENKVPYDKIRLDVEEIPEQISACKKMLLEKVHDRVKITGKEGYFLIDYTMLQKSFAEQIEGLTYDRDGVTRRVQKGFSAGFCFWSDGEITIPLNFELWFRKKDAEDLYKKKSDQAMELILWAKEVGLPFSDVRADGAFSSEKVLAFLKNQGLNLTMRIAKNKKITTDKNLEEIALAEHPELKLIRNQRSKTIKGCYKGISAYFTVQKRKKRGAKHEIVFIISTVERSAKEHIHAYGDRWPAEKYFRTAKQHLGITHCQSTDLAKQRFHIFSVMLSYTVLELTRNDKQESSIEIIIHSIRRQKILNLIA